MSIRGLPNIGPFTERVLARAGIRNVEQLRQTGAVRAYLAVRRTGANPGLKLLWVLQGALAGCDWHEVPNKDRLALMKELQSVNGASHAATRR